MHYKTIKERHNINNINNLYGKYKISVNDNNFNQITFRNLQDKSSQSIKNYRINDNKFVELKLIIISADLIKVKILIIAILKIIIRLERVQLL